MFDTRIKVGREVPPDTSVTILVSKGPRPIDIVDTSGDPYEQARTQLTELGFTVPAPRREYDVNVTDGFVISQTPERGTGSRGDTIELVVSKGPPLVEVPTVLVTTREDARASLRAAGFRVRVRHAEPYVAGLLVVEQDPGAGTSAPQGSTITIFVV